MSLFIRVLVWVSGLTEYYFDIETTGLEPKKDKIITLQWQQLDRFTGKPLGELQILKEWDSSEKKILKDFLPNLTCNHWDFIIIGKNLLFDFSFLDCRLKHHHLGEFDLSCAHERVVLGIKPVLVMINNGNFVGYDKLLDKDGALGKVDVPELYEKRKHPEIIKYIEEETRVFLKAFQTLKKEVPSLAKHL